MLLRAHQSYTEKQLTFLLVLRYLAEILPAFVIELSQEAAVKLRLSFVTLIPAVVLALVVFAFLFYTQTQREEFYYGEKITEAQIAYDQVLRTYELAATIAFDEFVNQPDILALYAGGYDADEATQAEIRATLMTELGDFYTRLSDMNFRQLHFHPPDNVSFLRFHRPERFGDDLTEIIG